MPAFAETGAEALTRVQERAYAVVVSETSLADMGGLELLDEVMKWRCETHRIVLANMADTAMAIQCLGRGHQVLPAPCDLGTLLSALERTCERNTWSPDAKTRRLVSQMHHVPSPPTMYFQIVEEVAAGNASLDKVAGIISQDPAISVKVLQLANSAVLGLRLQVIEPAEAVAYIGLETTKALVLCAHSFAAFDQVECAGFSMETLWGHSLVTGQFARKLAELEDSGREVSDGAFTAGLLHDIGKLLLAANVPGEFARIVRLAREQSAALCAVEKEVLGCGHAELGGALLSIWGIPTPIVEAVALHHQPASLPGYGFNPLVAVHAANVFAHAVPGDSETQPAPELDKDYLQALGLDARVDFWREECLARIEAGA
jgi:HD-like signal output (HDOD) protein/CheY-like chemotaxis protein